MQKPLPAALGFALLTFAFSCKKKDPPPSNVGNVMFVNGCAGTLPAIDAKADNVNIGGALNLPFRTSSGYKYVRAGAKLELSFFLTNVGTPVSKDSVIVNVNGHYTAFCGGLITQPTFFFTEDNMLPPSQGKAKIRFVNLSNDNLSVDATAQTVVIGKGVRTRQITPFVEVAAGNLELKAGDPGDISTVVATEPTTQTLAAGKIYTMMLTGSATGTGDSKLRLKVVNNN